MANKDVLRGFFKTVSQQSSLCTRNISHSLVLQLSPPAWAQDGLKLHITCPMFTATTWIETSSSFPSRRSLPTYNSSPDNWWSRYLNNDPLWPVFWGTIIPMGQTTWNMPCLQEGTVSFYRNSIFFNRTDHARKEKKNNLQAWKTAQHWSGKFVSKTWLHLRLLCISSLNNIQLGLCLWYVPNLSSLLLVFDSTMQLWPQSHFSCLETAASDRE